MKRSFKSLWRRFAADEDGAISILAVGAIVAAIGVSVIVIDAASSFADCGGRCRWKFSAFYLRVFLLR